MSSLLYSRRNSKRASHFHWPFCYFFSLSIDMPTIFVKMRITSMGILNIYNLWILLRKIAIYLVGRRCSSSWTFSLLKLTEVTSRESLYMKTSLQTPAIPSTLTAKKSMKMTFSSEKILQFFSGESKDYKYSKSPPKTYRHFKRCNISAIN